MEQYSIRPMRLREALALTRWRYDGMYASYNFSFWDGLAICLTQTLFRLLGTGLYYSVRNKEGELVGMFSFYPRRENAIEVGLGMRPDQTGHGAGLEFVQAGLDYARSQFKPEYFQLDVAVFNERARLVYERAGFTQTSTMQRTIHGKAEDYLKMSRLA